MAFMPNKFHCQQQSKQLNFDGECKDATKWTKMHSDDPPLFAMTAYFFAIILKLFSFYSLDPIYVHK